MNYIQGLQQILNEMSTSYGGVWGSSVDIGTHGGAFQAGDWYAPGDARNVFGLNTTGKKKRKHKKSKIHLYRRAFMESKEEEYKEPLDCIIRVNEAYLDYVSRVLTNDNIPFTVVDDVICLKDTDEALQIILAKLRSTITEDVFDNNVLVLIGEFYNHSDSLKQPQKRDEDYTNSQVKFGADVESKTEKNRHLAIKKAKQNIDQDKNYYEKIPRLNAIRHTPMVRGQQARMRRVGSKSII